MKRLCFLALSTLLLTGCASPRADKEPQPTGAYTEERDVRPQEQALFSQTYKGETALTPVKVSTQVVAGTNYRFLCHDKQKNKYRVVIFENLPCYGGKAEVISLERE